MEGLTRAKSLVLFCIYLFNLKIMTAHNRLCEKIYLLPVELHKALLEKKLPDKKNKYIDKDQDGIYLVFIKTLNKEKKQLVYKYVFYDFLFQNPFTYFIIHRSPLFQESFFHEFGEYFVIGCSNNASTYNLLYVDEYRLEEFTDSI